MSRGESLFLHCFNIQRRLSAEPQESHVYLLKPRLSNAARSLDDANQKKYTLSQNGT